ncbi:MAG: GPR endopeptidase [Lachnospiraceae bacterium]|jgi:spore protease|nr:GPR endopeptidase [Lachnospiraceae bacterium]
MGIQVRTDLALEAKETVQKPDEEIRGVRVEEEKDTENEIYITRVIIETKNGAKTMGKPMGTYITLEAPRMATPDEDYHREISEKVADQIRELLPDEKEELSVLVVGLGNRDVTADALGPNAADQLHITRHVVREFGKAAYNKNKMHMISAIVPGVMAKTGMETCEIIRGVVEETHPDVIIAIDALAARSTKRLNRTIQITDTGVQPGSGVGNHRHALTQETLGVPVIGIGIPTVVDAGTIVGDAVEQVEREVLFCSEVHALKMAELQNMYVTTKDIDDVVNRLSYTVSEAINIALEI